MNVLTHEHIRSLSSLYNEIKSERQLLKDEIKVLDALYIPTRYPDAIPGSFATGHPSREDAASAFRTAEKIYECVNRSIYSKEK